MPEELQSEPLCSGKGCIMRYDPSQVKDTLRILIGGYLLYLAWELFRAENAGLFPLAAAALFAVSGAVIIFISGRKLLKALAASAREADEQIPEEKE